MSTTAGVGSQDYVAINVFSVTSAICGFASSLSLFAYELLVIPLVGIIFGVIALRQIANSNETQTGRIWAWLGIVLSLVFVLSVGGREVLELNKNRSDSNAIAALLEQLGKNVKDGDYDAAYARFSPQFQSRVSKENLANVFGMYRGFPESGDLTSIEWNGRLNFSDPVQGQDRAAEGMALFKYAKAKDSLRESAIFRQTDGKWYIESLPELFPAEKPKKRGA